MDLLQAGELHVNTACVSYVWRHPTLEPCMCDKLVSSMPTQPVSAMSDGIQPSSHGSVPGRRVACQHSLCRYV